MKNKDQIILLLLIFLWAPVPMAAADGEDKWPGVDKTIVERIAAEQGRPAWTPLINTDQGDLLLFIFLLAGTAGGFMMGYNFQKLFVKKGPR